MDERDAGELREIAALQKEIAEQEALLDEHQSALVRAASTSLSQTFAKKLDGRRVAPCVHHLRDSPAFFLRGACSMHARQSANESALETMIKDMRRELASCREDSWRLDEVAELGDMKERLMMSMLPRLAPTSEGGEGLSAESVASGFAALSALNDEMDDELEALMQQLGSVKTQFSSLDAQRRTLEVSFLSRHRASHGASALYVRACVYECLVLQF